MEVHNNLEGAKTESTNIAQKAEQPRSPEQIMMTENDHLEQNIASDEAYISNLENSLLQSADIEAQESQTADSYGEVQESEPSPEIHGEAINAEQEPEVFPELETIGDIESVNLPDQVSPEMVSYFKEADPLVVAEKIGGLDENQFSQMVFEIERGNIRVVRQIIETQYTFINNVEVSNFYKKDTERSGLFASIFKFFKGIISIGSFAAGLLSGKSGGEQGASQTSGTTNAGGDNGMTFNIKG